MFRRKEIVLIVLICLFLFISVTTFISIDSDDGEAKNYLSENLPQDTGYYCGPDAIQNALYSFTNTTIPEKEIAEFSDTNKSGTEHDGLDKAIKRYGYEPEWHNYTEYTFEKLYKIIRNPDIFVIFNVKSHWSSNFGHYVFALDANNNSVLLGNLWGEGETKWITYDELSDLCLFTSNKGKLSVLLVKKKTLFSWLTWFPWL
jgi:hypothetical protein